MTGKNDRLIFIAGVTCLITIAVGCSVIRTSLVDNGTVTVKRLHTNDVYFSQVKVYQEDVNLCVSGNVKSRHYLSKNRMGHVDVTLITPSGKILKKVGTFHYPRKRPRRGRGRSSFKVRIPLIPPTGSSVLVEYHEAFDIPPEERLKKGEEIHKKFWFISKELVKKITYNGWL